MHKLLDSSQTLEDSTLIEVREHIEAMVEGFLGESLDSAHVDKPYDDMQCMAFIFKIYCFLFNFLCILSAISNCWQRSTEHNSIHCPSISIKTYLITHLLFCITVNQILTLNFILKSVRQTSLMMIKNIFKWLRNK